MMTSQGDNDGVAGYNITLGNAESSTHYVIGQGIPGFILKGFTLTSGDNNVLFAGQNSHKSEFAALRHWQCELRNACSSNGLRELQHARSRHALRSRVDSVRCRQFRSPIQGCRHGRECESVGCGSSCHDRNRGDGGRQRHGVGNALPARASLRTDFADGRGCTDRGTPLLPPAKLEKLPASSASGVMLEAPQENGPCSRRGLAG